VLPALLLPSLLQGCPAACLGCAFSHRCTVLLLSPYCTVLYHTVPQEDFKPMVTKKSGFTWRPERPNAPTFVEQKWGWTGLEVGE